MKWLITNCLVSVPIFYALLNIDLFKSHVPIYYTDTNISYQVCEIYTTLYTAYTRYVCIHLYPNSGIMNQILCVIHG